MAMSTRLAYWLLLALLVTMPVQGYAGTGMTVACTPAAQPRDASPTAPAPAPHAHHPAAMHPAVPEPAADPGAAWDRAQCVHCAACHASALSVPPALEEPPVLVRDFPAAPAPAFRTIFPKQPQHPPSA